MVWLISFLQFIAGSLLPYLIKRLGKKAVTLLYLAAFAAIITVLYASLKGAFNGLTASLPADSYLRFGLSLLPDNSFTAVTLISSAHAARWVALFNAKYISTLYQSQLKD